MKHHEWKHYLCIKCFFNKWDDQNPLVQEVDTICCECKEQITKAISFVIAPIQVKCNGEHVK